MCVSDLEVMITHRHTHTEVFVSVRTLVAPQEASACASSAHICILWLFHSFRSVGSFAWCSFSRSQLFLFFFHLCLQLKHGKWGPLLVKAVQYMMPTGSITEVMLLKCVKVQDVHLWIINYRLHQTFPTSYVIIQCLVRVQKDGGTAWRSCCSPPWTWGTGHKLKKLRLMRHTETRDQCRNIFSPIKHHTAVTALPVSDVITAASTETERVQSDRKWCGGSKQISDSC